ncbi:hypothetical protein LLG90_20240 [Aromatoleum toluclasticum]|uniref:hypothetical protein n=1 Tax=Aromatoleum toluclasticum TaxID=92003 RepID=UPI001D17F0DE|nr:hypothetical protein [Aromatoleum toluclasticum]MCC4117695.1 hypothetical protein [Aromatoleum toluclasticum]
MQTGAFQDILGDGGIEESFARMVEPAALLEAIDPKDRPCSDPWNGPGAFTASVPKTGTGSSAMRC